VHSLSPPSFPRALVAPGAGAEHGAAALPSSPSVQEATSERNLNLKNGPIQPHAAYRKRMGRAGCQHESVLS